MNFREPPSPALMNRVLLVGPLSLRSDIGTQPQRDVRRLHGRPYHSHQVVVQRLQVRLIPQRGREGFEGIPRIVLPPVEATIYETLDVPCQRTEQCSDKEGGNHDDELRQPLLTGYLCKIAWVAVTPPKYTDAKTTVSAA